MNALVTAASRHGATQQIVEAIGGTLSDRGVAGPSACQACVGRLLLVFSVGHGVRSCDVVRV